MSQKRYSEMFFRKRNKYIVIIEKIIITHDLCMYYEGPRSHPATGLCTRKLTHPASGLHYESCPLSVHWKSLKKKQI